MSKQTVSMKKFKYVLTRIFIVLAVFSFTNYTAIKVYAVYYPADHITNPSCPPSDATCYVSLLPDQTGNAGKLFYTNGTNPAWASSLYWDSTNGRLGIGTNSPTNKLSIVASNKFNSPHQIYSMGDSLTYSNSNIASGGVYENKLISLLGSSWAENNKGIPGQGTGQMLARFNSDVTSHSDAEYVIVWGGVNDASGNVTASIIEENLQAMYDSASAAGLKVIAVTITPWKGSTYWTIQRQGVVDNVNTWIKNSARNVDYRVDAYSALVDSENPNALKIEYDSGDNIHLNTAGYEAVGTLIYNTATFSPVVGSALNSSGDSLLLGKVGVGISPLSKFDINGGMSVGSYAGVNASPLNGMIVSGNVGIGTNSPAGLLDVNSILTVSQNKVVGVGTSSPDTNFQVGQSTTGPGTVNTVSGSATVTGNSGSNTGTLFFNTFKVGDTITVNGETHTISAINSSTSLTTDTTWTNSNSYSPYSLVGGKIFSVLGNGNIGAGTTTPVTKFQIQESTPRTSFTGTGFGTLLLRNISGTNNYTTIDFQGGVNETSASSRIASIQTGGGSKLQFGTTNTYGSGINNTAMTIDRLGHIGLGSTDPVSELHINASSSSSSYGTVSLGSGLFDGTSSGHFVGSSSGTSFAINESNGYVGDLFNMQTYGVSKLKVDSAGNMYLNNVDNNNTASTLYVNSVRSGALSSRFIQFNSQDTGLNTSNVGFFMQYQKTTNSTTGSAIGSSIFADAGNTGENITVDNLYGVQLRTRNMTINPVTNQYGLYVSNSNNGGSGTVVNSYGVYVSGMPTVTGTSFAFYNATTAPSYFNGNVGIGLYDPSYKLNVSGDVHATNFWAVSSITGSTVKVNTVKGNSAELAFQLSGSATNVMNFDANANVGIGTNGGSILNRLHVTNTPAAGTHTARIANTLGGVTQNNGLLVLAGNNTGVASSEMITFQRPDATVIGSISQNAATTIAYNTTSDARLKENFDLNNPLTTKGLNDLLKIKVVDFDFINDSSHVSTQGFIAQQLDTVYPYAVSTNGDDGLVPLGPESTPWMVDYGRLTPLLVKSIQDLDLKLSNVVSLDLTKSNSVGTLIVSFLKDQITFAKEMTIGVLHIDDKICVDDVCATKEQFKALLLQAGGSSNLSPVTEVAPPTNTTAIGVVSPAEIPIIPSTEQTIETITSSVE